MRLTACLLPVAMSAIAVPTQAQTLTTVYSFQGGAVDGAGPQGGLLAVGGLLYGTTRLGGAAHSGTIFSFNPMTKAETVLHSFAGMPAEGAGPTGALVYLNGTFYGTTSTGGAANMGTVFAYKAGTFSTIHSFAGDTDGATPEGGLIAASGLLYGTTSQGGSPTCFDNEGCGTVFSVDPASFMETVLHAFAGNTDGAGPKAAVTLAGGAIYGTTLRGGGLNCFAAIGCGTIFKVDLSSGQYSQIHAFAGGASDGASPAAELKFSRGTLYGVTKQGGGTGCNTNGCGTIFAVDTGTDAETLLFGGFGGIAGAKPSGGPALSVHRDADGRASRAVLIGPAGSGGTTMKGVVYQYDLATRTETVLYDFSGGGDGGLPEGHLTRKGQYYYGVTYQGGAADSGTIYRIAP